MPCQDPCLPPASPLAKDLFAQLSSSYKGIARGLCLPLTVWEVWAASFAEMSLSLSPHCFALSSSGGSCWPFPVPLPCPLPLAQNIRRPLLPDSPFFKQRLRSHILCLCSMFQPRRPKPFANISSSLPHLSLFSPRRGREPVERAQCITGWGRQHLE